MDYTSVPFTWLTDGSENVISWAFLKILLGMNYKLVCKLTLDIFLMIITQLNVLNSFYSCIQFFIHVNH